MNRRDFLASAFAGMALLTMPAFLRAAPEAGAAGAVTPVNPFMDWFGIDQAVIRRVLSELTANGATDAELFFQHRRNNAISMEDGIVSRASSEIEQGVGLRVVVGDQVGCAYTEDLTPEAMLQAARTAAAIAQGSKQVPPAHFDPQRQGDLYRTDTPWGDVDMDRKLPIIQRLEALARESDPAIEKVRVFWGDSEERVLIATLDGRLVTDYRPGLLLTCMLTAGKQGQTRTNQASIGARDGIESTGFGRREYYRHTIMPRMSCTFMEKGPHTEDEIIASIDRGIIAETFNGGRVAIGAGDFTFYIKNGWLVEKGKITAPIQDVNLIGNGPEVLKRISMVADDPRLDTGGWECGKSGQNVPVSVGMPTVLVSKLTVGGENAG